MSNSPPKDYPLAEHDAHARSVPLDAYWKQVRRTVGGEPVGDAQIELIVKAIVAGLSLTKSDVVLDLACGNGALSAHLFDRCAGLVGVDNSPRLIEVAQSDFARPPNYRFRLGDAVSYLAGEQDKARFTKVVIYGAFQYFSRDDAALVLKYLHERFNRVTTVFIGNLPDKRHTDRFYRDRIPTRAELGDHEARIGVWYLPEEFQAMSRTAGWSTSISHMPAGFYASDYRFDATLERGAS